MYKVFENDIPPVVITFKKYCNHKHINEAVEATNHFTERKKNQNKLNSSRNTKVNKNSINLTKNKKNLVNNKKNSNKTSI